MDLAQLLIAAFAVLIGALLLPLPYAARMFIFLALTVLGVLTFLGGGMQVLLAMLP